MGLRTTVHGFPRSSALRRARWLFSEEEIDREALAIAERADLEAFLELQSELAIDLRSDGSLDRDDMVSFLAERVGGVERGGLVRVLGNRYYRRPLVTGEVSHDDDGPLTVAGWTAARELAGGEGAAPKAILTGPYTLMHWSANQHYPDRASCARAFAGVVVAEASALAAAGVRDLQIDEPAAGVHARELDLFVEGLRAVVEAASGVRVWLHLAYGDYDGVFSRAADLPIHGISLELANRRLAGIEALASLPPEWQVVAGVVDAQDAVVESAGTVADRARRVAALVDPGRLWLAPDSGLQALSRDVAADKLRRLSEAAAAL